MTQRVGKITISHKRAREAFDYDLDTGWVTWRIVPKHRRSVIKLGDRAGSLGRKGYRWIYIDGQSFQEHRFIWFWMTGRSPSVEIDHKDRNKANNKWDNLRLATNFEQQANKVYRPNRHGYKGVHARLLASGVTKYWADICKDGIHYYLGFFPTALSAHQRYVQEAKKLPGEFYRP